MDDDERYPRRQMIGIMLCMYEKAWFLHPNLYHILFVLEIDILHQNDRDEEKLI